MPLFVVWGLWVFLAPSEASVPITWSIKEGYDGKFLLLAPHLPKYRVVMIRAKAPRVLTECSPGLRCDALAGFGGHLCLPRVPGVGVSKQGDDVDYGARRFLVKAAKGRFAMVHGAGPTWTLGIPSSDDVWASVEYSEEARENRLYPWLDVRGKTADSKLWRYLGKLGESVHYRDLPPEQAALFDRILDGACLK